MAYIDEIVRRNKTGQNSGKAPSRIAYEQKKEQQRKFQSQPGYGAAKAGSTVGVAAIHQRMQEQIAQAQLAQSRTSFMFREQPAQAVPASLSPIQRLKSALVLPDMSESERLRRQLEAMENKVNADKAAYSEAKGTLSAASRHTRGRAGGIGAGGGNQFMAYDEADAALTESKKAYNDLLDKYNAALARERQEEMSAYSAQEIGAKLEDLKAQRDAAEAELREASQTARTTPYTIYNPEAKKAALDRASQAKDKLDALQQEYNTWLNQYYVRENEEKRAAISQDAAMSGQYASARELQEDLEKVSAVMKGSGGSLKRQEEIEEYREYLRQKYGLDDLAVERQSMDPAYLAHFPRNDGGWNNVQALYDELEARYKAALGAVTEAGYDYERMSGYEQMLEDSQRAAQMQRHWQNMADRHPILSSLGTVAAAPAQGMDYLGLLLSGRGRSDDNDYANYVPANTYNMDITNFVSTVRGQVSRDIEENTNWEAFGENVGSFLYNTGMSMADSAAQVATLGKASLLFMGMSAASNQAKNVIERGGTNRQAMMGGLAAGAAEVVFEKFSIDSLLKIDNISDMKSLVKSMAKQAGVEGSEEMFTEIANILSDAAIMRGNSDFANSVAGYRAQGLTEQEAKRRAYLDCVGQVAWAGAGGALSGFGMGGGAGAMNLAGNYLGSARGGTDYTGSVDAQSVPSVQTEAESAPVGTVEAQTQINTNPLLHTIEQQRIINEYQGSTDQGLKNAFEEHYKGKPEKFLRYNISPVSERQAADASRLLGGDYSGYTNAINSSAINHIIKRHGPEGKADHSMADMNDPARVGYVLDNYDSVEVLTQSGDLDYSTGFNMADNTPAPMLMFKKRVNGTYYVVEAVPDSKYNKMWVVSAYMSKANKSTGNTVHASDVTSPEPTSENEHVPSKVSPAVTNVSQGTEGVKRNLPEGHGAMSSVFEYKEAQNQTHSSDLRYRSDEQEMEGLRAGDRTHQVSTLESSQYHALERYNSDYEGEKTELFDENNNSAWGDTEFWLADMFIKDAVREARKTGDYSEVLKLQKIEDAKKSEWGQVGRVLAELADAFPEKVVAKAAAELESGVVIRQGKTENVSEDVVIQQPRKLSDMEKQELLNKVYNYAVELNDITPGDTRSLVELIKKLNVERHTQGLFSKKTSRSLEKRLLKEAKAADGEEFLRGIAAQQIINMSHDHMKVGFWNALKSYRIMNLLSGLGTITVNIASNTTHDISETLATDISVPMDILISKLTGTRTIAVDKGWGSKAKRTGASEGFRRSAIEVALDAEISEGSDKYGQRAGRTFKMSGNFAERFLSTFAKWQGYFLQSTDEMAKGGVRAEAARGLEALNEKAAAKGKGPVVSEAALERVPEEMAKQRTFQSDMPMLTRAFVAGKNALNKIHTPVDAGGGSFGAGDLVGPFIKIAPNLGVMTVDYSSVGFAKAVGQLSNVVRDAKRGTCTPEKQAYAVTVLGRSLKGTVGIAFWTGLALKQILKVAGSDDEDEAALQAGEGMSGMQFNTSALERWVNGQPTEWQDGDTVINLSSLEPLNAQMAMGALIAASYEEDGTFEAGEIANANITAIYDSILDLPVLSTVQDCINNFKYSTAENLGGQLGDAAGKYLASQVSGFIPASSFLSRAAGAIDPVVRDKYSGESIPENAWNNIKYTFPWARNTLPAKTDSWGNERKYQDNPLLQALNSTVLPLRINQYHTNEVNQELYRLKDSIGEAAFPDKSAPGTVRYDNESYKLTYEERQEYKNTSGQNAFELMRKLINNGFYDKMSDAEKNELLSQVQGYAKDRAKEAYLQSQGVSYSNNTYNKMRQADNSGIGALNWLMYDTELDKIKGNGAASYLESAQAANKIDATNKMRGQLWALQNPNAKPEKNPFTGTLAQMGVDPKDVIHIMEVKDRIADDYENYVRDEEKTKPSKSALMASIYRAYLVKQGYAADVIEAVEKVYNVNNIIISSKTSKQSEAWVANHPELVEKYG